MKNLAYLIFLFILAACQNENTTVKEVKSTKPNIIYIMADDMGYADVGCYGQQLIKTPDIDKLASQGMRFTDHYAGTSVCAPSRCVLMTGMHMGHAAVRGNKQWQPSGQMPLPSQMVTVAELMKQGGYTTGMIGKWGLGNVETEGSPNKQGWDYFYGYTDQVLAHNYYPEYLIKNEEKVYLDNEVKYLDSTDWHSGLGSYSTVKKEYSNDLFTNEALSFIDANHDSPFFLYLPYTVPHNNGEAPEGQKQEVPDYGSYKNEDWASDSLGYAAMIERLDNYVGKITAKIDSLGLGENTLIIFTSDNGPMQETVGFTRFFDSNGIYRGGKRDLYEGGIRIPFIARWPETIKAGSTSSHASSFVDFLPTACEIGGVPVPESTDGTSYLTTLKGGQQKANEFLYFEFYEGGKSQAIRKDNWKAVRTNVYKNPNGDWELYNLDTDPSEETNLASQEPEVLKTLVDIANSAHVHDPNWPLFNTEESQ
ncbi:arylsulfatase [Chondrinema litorale]|uniref:arylsulfatase n=1 Tax=Chondrinema litorale TaxID=2994555 RepID=UPI002543A6F7|nr:arylsulfatase [Chondrinema litorale]UZR99269.1 arylsulfatase [Chondrinema litorale]